MECLQHQVDLTKDQFAFKQVEPSLEPTFDVPCSRFFAQLGKRKGGHGGGQDYRKYYDVCSSTGKRIGVDLDDLWSIYA